MTTEVLNHNDQYLVESENQQLKQEREDLKQMLVKLWIQISKSFNEDFEEILQLGINSDIADVLNAILIVEEARQEQIRSERQQIAELTDQVKSLQSQYQTNSGNEELKEIQKQYREISELVIQYKQSNEEKETKIKELNKVNQQLQIEISLLTQKIKELSAALVQTKEEKINYMEQSQKQIKILLEKDLQNHKQIQQLQVQKAELENTVRKNSSRNSIEHVNHYNFPTQREDDQVRMLSCSPRTTHIDFSKIILQGLQNKKTEMVQGSSLQQMPYRFGK